MLNFKHHNLYFLLMLVSLSPEAGMLDNTYWFSIASERNLPPEVLYAVALKESRLTISPGNSAPYPWTLRTKSGSQRFKTINEAKKALIVALKINKPIQLDIGIMQINLHYHRNRVKSPEDLLDPITSIQIGADILVESILRHPNDLELGIGRYYARNEKKARAYGKDILRMSNLLQKL